MTYMYLYIHLYIYILVKININIYIYIHTLASMDPMFGPRKTPRLFQFKLFTNAKMFDEKLVIELTTLEKVIIEINATTV